MDIDWEVEIGGGAPIIDTDWPGFIDLRSEPNRLREIAEAVSFPPLANLLTAINGASSPWWTSKCDFWRPEPFTSACYVDVLPRATSVFADWHEAESLCRACVARIGCADSEFAKSSIPMACFDRCGCNEQTEISINMVIRAAISKKQEGFGITAYMSATANSVGDATAALAHAMDLFADALLYGSAPQGSSSTLK